MRTWSILFLILMSSIAFAQSIDDIGRTLFVELLGVREYPGSPFSGNPVNDIILFFLVPTILIIMIIFMMVGRIFPSGYKSLRLLLGIGAYLFIVAGGYFAFFIRLAGPTFIFFIFILGVLFFFLEFIFGKRGGEGRIREGGGPRYAEAAGITEHDKIMHFLGIPRLHGPETKFMQAKARELWQGIKRAENIAGKGGRIDFDIIGARNLLLEIEIKLFRKALTDEERDRRYHV